MKETVLFFSIFWFLQGFVLLGFATSQDSLPDVYCPCLPVQKCSGDSSQIVQKIRQLLPKCKDQNFIRCCPLLQSNEKFSKKRKLPDVLHKISEQMSRMNFSGNYREIFNYFQANMGDKSKDDENNLSENSLENLENLKTVENAKKENNFPIEKDMENNDENKTMENSNDYKIATSLSRELNYSTPVSLENFKFFEFQDRRTITKVKDERKFSSFENVGMNILEDVKNVMNSMTADSEIEKESMDTRKNIKNEKPLKINQDKEIDVKIDLNKLPEHIIPPINFSYPEYVGYTRNFEENSRIFQKKFSPNSKFDSFQKERNEQKITKKNMETIPNSDESSYLVQLIRRAFNFESLRLFPRGRSLNFDSLEDENGNGFSNRKKPCTITPIMVEIIERLKSKLRESKRNRTISNSNQNSKIKRMSEIDEDEILNLEKSPISIGKIEGNGRSRYEEYNLKPDFHFESKSNSELISEENEENEENEEDENTKLNLKYSDEGKIFPTEIVAKVFREDENGFFEWKNKSLEHKKSPETLDRVSVEAVSENFLKPNETGENSKENIRVRGKNSASARKNFLLNEEGRERLETSVQNGNSKLNEYLKRKTVEKKKYDRPYGTNRNSVKIDRINKEKIKELINKKQNNNKGRQYSKLEFSGKIATNKKINKITNKQESNRNLNESTADFVTVNNSSFAKKPQNLGKNSTKIETKQSAENSTKIVPVRTFRAPPRKLPKKPIENRNKNQSLDQLRGKSKWFSRLNNSRPIFRVTNRNNRNRSGLTDLNSRKGGNVEIIKNPDNLVAENSENSGNFSLTKFTISADSKLLSADELNSSRSTTISERVIAPLNTVAEQILETRNGEGFANVAVDVNFETKRPTELLPTKSILGDNSGISSELIENKKILKSYSDIFRGDKVDENKEKRSDEENERERKGGEKIEESKEINKDRSERLKNEIFGRNIDDSAKKVIEYFGASFNKSKEENVSKEINLGNLTESEKLIDKRGMREKENDNKEIIKNEDTISINSTTVLNHQGMDKIKKDFKTFGAIRSILLGPMKMLIVNQNTD